MTANGRPRRIDQVLPSIVGRDAVSHHTLEAQKVLRSLGFVSEIYAVTMGPEMTGRVRPISELPSEGPSTQWLCYQASTGSPAAEVFAEHPGRKLLDYHNITPAELVASWMPELADEVSNGRKQMSDLAPLVDFALADSAYNKQELDAWGYRRSVVSMLMVDHTNFDVSADSATASRLRREKEAGGSDWLFVGQFLPHKSQHEVVEAFAAYKSAYDEKARLHLVGRPSSAGYTEAVRLQVRELGLEDSVHLAGSVTAAELAALYEGCDLYLCCSEHEGFCAPLLEAMHHGLPILAFAAGAVPETLGGAGLVVSSKAPALLAAGAARLAGDEELRAELVAAGRRRAGDFTPEKARAAFAQSIEQALQEFAS